MNHPPVVSPEEWQKAHQAQLVKEKAHMRAGDTLAADRRRQPWMAVETEYLFDGPNGKATLLDLFEGRTQLVLYRAFFEPGVYGWPEHACRGCSLGADQVSNLAHLHARDTTLAYASRAPQDNIVDLKQRMNWHMPWYTITDSFDVDFGVDLWHGHNVFFRDGEEIYRTHFIDKRGDEAMGTVWSYLDATPLGRQEAWENSPEGYPQTPPYKWWNWHDNYEVDKVRTRSGLRSRTRARLHSARRTPTDSACSRLKRNCASDPSVSCGRVFLIRRAGVPQSGSNG